MRRISHDRNMTEGVIWKQLLLFFVPILFGSLFQHLYSTVDAIIVGQYAGKEGLAAIDSTGTMTRLFINFFVGVSSGATILISQQYGAKNDMDVSRSVHTGIAFSLCGGAILAVLGVLLTPLGTRLVGVPLDIEGPARDYLYLSFACMLPSMVYNMGAGILRAVGDSKRPLYYLLASSLVNIALDLLFVAVLPWGVIGAGLATLIAQILSAVLVLAALMREKEPVRLSWRRVRMESSVLRKVLRTGLPIGLQSSMYPLANTIVRASINRLGTNVIAAWAVCGKLDFVIWVAIDSLAIAASTFAAQNYGAKLYARVRQGTRICVYLSLAVILPLSLLLYLFAEPLSRLFVADTEVIRISGELIRFYAPFFFTFIWGDVLSGVIRGTGETLRPMLITLLCTCVLRVVWIIAVVPLHTTIEMIIGCFPLTWVVTSATFIVYHWRYSARRLHVRA